MRIKDSVFIFFKVPKSPEVKQVKFGSDLSKELTKRWSKCQVVMADEKYRITTKEEIERLLEANFHKSRDWTWDIYDCDNYARSLWSLMQDIGGNLAFGMAYVDRLGGRHALNIFRDEKGEWYYVEPQNNKIFHVGGPDAIMEAYKPYVIIL